MLIELHPLIEVGGKKSTYIFPLGPSGSVRCEETVGLASNT